MVKRNRVILFLMLLLIVVLVLAAARGYRGDGLNSILDLPREIKEGISGGSQTRQAAIAPASTVTVSRGSTAANANSGGSPSVQGEKTRRVALIRMEDVGPGGKYSTLEDLGRLRAVVDYLYSQGVPFHVTVISRYKTLNPDGSWREAGIDDPAPTPETQAFIRLLYYMESRGGVLGIHGYTHQYGETRRPDDGQNSGTGNEFNTGDASSTTLTYAQDRVELAVRAFQKLGLEPAFWETPHNVATIEQRDVFRSAFGIQYESLNKKDLQTVYLEGENQFLSPNLGSVYVPTPLYYVEGGSGTANSVEHILRRMIFFSGMASFFYHPFLEYPFLEPVYDYNGTPKVVDGLPLYRYQAGSESYLQRMVKGLQDWGYRFVNLHEVVPFTPGHRLRFSAGDESSWLTGDFNGDSRSELLVREGGQIKVLTVKPQMPRWRTATNFSPWLEVPAELKEAAARKGDFNGDGKDDLVFYQPRNGQWSVALSGGDGFSVPLPWLAGWAKGDGWKIFVGDFNGDRYDDLLVFNRNDQSWQVAENNRCGGFQPHAAALFGLGETSLQLAIGDVNGDRVDDLIAYNTTLGKVQVALVRDGRFSAPQTWLSGGERFKEMMAGDFNGDSRCDLMLYNAREGTWHTLLSNGGEMVLQSHSFGPWAPGAGRVPAVGDFDGNGKSDLASLERRNGENLVDLAYSYQNR